jgi:16S rRNA (guanine966-N2)-methyltransferase
MSTGLSRSNFRPGAAGVIRRAQRISIIILNMKQKRPKSPVKPLAQLPGDDDEAVALPRIVGGKFRGRRLSFDPTPNTRPMKDRVREALFNLIGPDVEGKHAIDLFAGTGALGFESLSRGAASATFVERHFPTADSIRKNAAAFGLSPVTTVLPANVLLWPRRMPNLPHEAWIVFCSPPWNLYAEQCDAVLALLNVLLDHAPQESIFVVEADEHFDLRRLPQPDDWFVREYPPAVLAILRKGPN